MKNSPSKLAFVATLGLALAFTFSCSGGDDNNEGNSGAGGSCDISDYRTKKIGDQVWMAENLNCDVGVSRCYGEGGIVLDISSGGIIRITLSNSEIKANCVKYGRLYDYETAKTACPSGWHLPSYDEWTTLLDFVGGEDIAGAKLKATSGWSFNVNGKTKYRNGTDNYGFSALPGGIGDSGGAFSVAGASGNWWSSTINGSDICYLLIDDSAKMLCNTSLNSNDVFFSVRCVQN